MSVSCEELRARAAGTMSQDRGEPERASAEAHAASCPGCRAALDEGSAVVRLLDAAPAPAPPDAAVLARVRAAVLAEIEAESAHRAPNGVLAASLLATIGLAFGAVLAVAKEAAPFGKEWYEAFAVLAVAAVSGAFAFKARLAAVAVLAVSASFAFVSGSGDALFGVYGLRCLAVELFASALPLGLATWAAFTRRRPATPLYFAAVAGGGALAGQAALHLTCKAGAQLPHLLVSHTGGVLAAALLGLAISRLRGLRAQATGPSA